MKRPPTGTLASRAAIVVPAAAGAAVGAVAEYLLDPERGRSRRAQLRQRSAAAVRHSARRLRRTAGRNVNYLRGHVRGAAHHVATMRGAAVDDRTLVDKVRSEVLGDPRFHRCPVNIDAVYGVVTLRGQLDDDVTRDLVAAIGKVHGVVRIENLLHTPHTTTPNA